MIFYSLLCFVLAVTVKGQQTYAIRAEQPYPLDESANVISFYITRPASSVSSWVDHQLSMAEAVLALAFGLHPYSYEEDEVGARRTLYLQQMTEGPRFYHLVSAGTTSDVLEEENEDNYLFNEQQEDFPRLDQLVEVSETDSAEPVTWMDFISDRFGRKGGPAVTLFHTSGTFDGSLDAVAKDDDQLLEANGQPGSTSFQMEVASTFDENSIFTGHYEVPETDERRLNAAATLQEDLAVVADDDDLLYVRTHATPQSSRNWGMVTFFVLAGACALVWLALLATCSSYRNHVLARQQYRHEQFISDDDNDLLEPLCADEPQPLKMNQIYAAQEFKNPLNGA